MGQILRQIAEKLRDTDKKVQLIYAFNGTGKTRLSQEFKNLVDPKNKQGADNQPKVLYYNAFTEDLFFWDNDLDTNIHRKLMVRPNNFTNLAIQFLIDQDSDNIIVTKFQHYTNQSLTPKFSTDFSEVTFSLQRGNDKSSDNIKISKGEESNFIWCVFFSLLEQIIEVLNTAEDERSTDKFNQLKYVFIDDPVTSLDENHLIELAVNLAGLIKSSKSDLQFLITTHSPIFYNVFYNEMRLNKKGNGCRYLLNKFEDGTFELEEKEGDSNHSFSYHLHLKQILEQAIENDRIEKYHFTLLRNLYEKTARFLGYSSWSDLLPKYDGHNYNKNNKNPYLSRIINFTSHRTLSNDEVSEPTNPEKKIIKFLLEHLVSNNHYYKKE